MAKRKRLWLWICATTPLALCGAGYVAVERAFSTVSLEAEKNALRGFGIPLTAAEVRTVESELPERDNVARDYLRAFDRLTSRTNGAVAELERLGYVDNPLLLLRKALLIARLQPALEPLHAISKGKGVNFHRAWEKGIALELAELSQFTKASRWLRESAAQKICLEDEEGAVRDIETAIRMSRHIRNEPSLFSFSIGLSQESSAWRALAKILSFSKRRSTFQAAEALLALPGDYDFRRALSWEVVTIESAIREVQKPVPPTSPGGGMCGSSDPSEALVISCKFRTVRDGIKASLIKPIRLACESIPAGPQSLRTIYEGLERVQADPSLDDFASRIAWQLSSGFQDYADNYRAYDSARKLVACGVAVALGKPVSKESEIDPVTEQPFKTRIAAGRTTVYGYGRDKRDDGGRPSWTPRVGNTDDVVIISASLR